MLKALHLLLWIDNFFVTVIRIILGEPGFSCAVGRGHLKTWMVRRGIFIGDCFTVRECDRKEIVKVIVFVNIQNTGGTPAGVQPALIVT